MLGLERLIRAIKAGCRCWWATYKGVPPVADRDRQSLDVTVPINSVQREQGNSDDRTALKMSDVSQKAQGHSIGHLPLPSSCCLGSQFSKPVTPEPAGYKVITGLNCSSRYKNR